MEVYISIVSTHECDWEIVYVSNDMQECYSAMVERVKELWEYRNPEGQPPPIIQQATDCRLGEVKGYVESHSV